ncbi:MAG: 30S ribosomal protein S6 [Candidatus Dojkabacteria bacterium]|nr:MAG: 30S ribosomal protein S6 [Candidatus Dojkabacteria bacterium]
MAKKQTEVLLLTTKPEPSSYEMVVVFKPFLPDKVRNEADDRVGAIVGESGGKVSSKDIWGKRYLAYPIQSHVEGYYIMYQFETLGEGVEYVKKHMNRHQEVLRYLIIKKDGKDTGTPKIKVKKSIITEDTAPAEE